MLPFILYQVLFTLLLPLYLLVIWPLRVANKKESWRRLPERLGLWLPCANKADLWLHAVSNGETLGLVSVAKALLAKHLNLKIVFTCNTLTAAQLIKSLLPEAQQVMMPLDHVLTWKGFYNRFQPKTLLIAESELWPCLLSFNSRRMNVELISARLSNKSAKRWAKWPRLLKYMVSHVTSIHPQSDIDHQNWSDLLAPLGFTNKLSKQLNLKITSVAADAPKTPPHPYLASLAKSRPVWLAASTHEGEEEIVIEAHKLLRKRLPGLITIILLRHPNRLNSVVKLIQKEGISYSLRKDRNEIASIPNNAEIMLVATTGELKRFYASVDVALVGGSLKPIGGHNVIEAIQEDCLAIVGPYNFNFSYITEAAINKGLIPVVHDATSLSNQLFPYFEGGENQISSKLAELKLYLNGIANKHQQQLSICLNKWEKQLELQNT